MVCTSNPWMYISVNHDRSRDSIGRMRQIEYRLEVELFQPMTMEQVFQIFGSAGILMLEAGMHEGMMKILKFEILEFAYCAQP